MDIQNLLQREELEELEEVVDPWDEWEAYRDEWEFEHGRCFDCGREPKECICDSSE